MKLEMNNDASTCVGVLGICAAVVTIAFLIYNYNVAVFTKGYTQKQLENSQMTMWVKE